MDGFASGARFPDDSPVRCPRPAVGGRAHRRIAVTGAALMLVLAGAAGADQLAACAQARRVEASLSPSLKKLIADLRARHGRNSVKVIAGQSYRYVRDADGRPLRLSCHATGEAFDGHLSLSALATVRARRQFGLITYSGAMRHAHVSSCAREAGVRARQVVNALGWPVKPKADAVRAPAWERAP